MDLSRMPRSENVIDGDDSALAFLVSQLRESGHLLRRDLTNLGVIPENRLYEKFGLTEPHGPEGGSESMNLQQAAQFGRFGDTTVGHLTPGEIVVPLDAQTPELNKKIMEAIRKAGADPKRFVVGEDQNSYNPATGAPEFGLFSGIKNAVKKIAGSAGGSLIGGILGNTIAPGVGGAIGSALGAAGGTKLTGGTLGEAIGAGLGNFAGGKFLGDLGGFGLSGTGFGQLLGGAGGALAGGFLLGEPTELPQGQLPPGGQIPALPSIPGAPAQNPPGQVAPGAALPGGGSTLQPLAPGVKFLSPIIDRNTGQTIYGEVSAFRGSLGPDRTTGWGNVIYV